MFSGPQLPLYRIRPVTHPMTGYRGLFHADCYEHSASSLVSGGGLRLVHRLLWAICVVAGPITVSALQAVQIPVAITRVRHTIFILLSTVLVLAITFPILFWDAFGVPQLYLIRRGVSRVRFSLHGRALYLRVVLPRHHKTC